jgi:hypothetical protein
MYASLAINDRIETPQSRNALELAFAAVGELEPRAGDRSFTVLETSTSPGRASSASTSAEVHRDALDFPVDDLALAGVQTRSDFDP